MIISLVLNGMYNIGLDGNNRVEIDDKKVSIKDIPYVRYKFDQYEDTEVDYIEASMKKFPYSVHVADIKLGADTTAVCEKLDTKFNVNGEGDVNLVMFVDIDVDADTVERCQLSSNIAEMLENVDQSYIDRFVVRDCDQAIVDKSRADKIIKYLHTSFDIDVSNIALCGSILSGDKGYCVGCLPASVVRDLQTLKSDDIELPLVPEGHQNCGGCCGCTRYKVVDSDIKVTKSERVSGNRKGKVKGEPGESSAKKAPVRKSAPAYNLFGSDD